MCVYTVDNKKSPPRALIRPFKGICKDHNDLVFFFPAKKGPIFLGTDPPDLGTDHEGTARKYLARHGIMRARHGNIWHGTDPPDLGTARHGTSLHMTHMARTESKDAIRCMQITACRHALSAHTASDMVGKLLLLHVFGCG